MSFIVATIRGHPLANQGWCLLRYHISKTQISPFILGWGCIMNCAM